MAPCSYCFACHIGCYADRQRNVESDAAGIALPLHDDSTIWTFFPYVHPVDVSGVLRTDAHAPVGRLCGSFSAKRHPRKSVPVKVIVPVKVSLEKELFVLRIISKSKIGCACKDTSDFSIYIKPLLEQIFRRGKVSDTVPNKSIYR